MPAVARGDTEDEVLTNHSCDTDTTTEGKSGNVFINGIGVHRQGDLNTDHRVNPPDCPFHQTAISVGSTTVFANNPPRGVARVGDLYDGGEEVSTGSENVFAGG
jgi:uncharacterized Zn-binding protein involved in type VI secretion